MNNFTRSNVPAGSAWNAPVHHDPNEPRQDQLNNAGAMRTTFNFAQVGDPSNTARLALAHHEANEFRGRQFDEAAAMHAHAMQYHQTLMPTRTMNLPAQYLDNAADIYTNMSNDQSPQLGTVEPNRLNNPQVCYESPQCVTAGPDRQYNPQVCYQSPQLATAEPNPIYDPQACDQIVHQWLQSQHNLDTPDQAHFTPAEQQQRFRVTLDGALEAANQPTAGNAAPAQPPKADPVPIPRDTQPTVVDSGVMDAPTGPMSRAPKLPARPRPGRKPMEEGEGKANRKIANRISQRNFRDRRVQKLADIQVELVESKKRYEDETAQLRREHAASIQAAKNRYEELANKYEALQEWFSESINRSEILTVQVNALKQQLRNGQDTPSDDSSSGQRDVAFRDHRQPQIPTPPFDQGTETDFTNYGRPARTQSFDTAPNMLRSRITANGQTLGAPFDQAIESCGYCTNDADCNCRAPPSYGPGECARCQADPAQRAACQSAAARAQSAPSNQLAPIRTTQCSSFMSDVQLSGVPLPAIAEIIGTQQLPVYSSTTSGFQVDEESAAQALQTLATGRRTAPLVFPQ